MTMSRLVRSLWWALPAGALLGTAVLLWIVSRSISADLGDELAMQRVHVERIQELERAAEVAHLATVSRWVSDNTRRELRDQQALEAAQALRAAIDRLGRLAAFDEHEHAAAARLLAAAAFLSNEVMQALYTTDVIGTTSDLEMAMDTLRSHATTATEIVSRAGSSSDVRLTALRRREVAIETAFVVIALVILIMAITTSRRQLATSERMRSLEQEAARQRAQFFANISHELRTPLVAIRGFAGLVGGAPGLDDDGRDAARQIEAQAQELLGLINNILDAAKLESTHLVLDIEAVDLGALVDRVVQRCRSLVAAKPIELAIDVEPGLKAQADFVKLQQVLVNLVANAVKFTDRGQVQVRGRVRDGQALIEVADTGCGIPQQELERIWEPFRQARGATDRKHGGTGLGLAIVRGLVERMSGRVAVASIVGCGSTFSVWLPLAPATTQASPSTSEARS